MARLYADEDFPRPVADAPRRLGHDVLTAGEAGQAGRGIPDDAVLTFAYARGRAVLTHNRKDFRDLHHLGQAHSGLIFCTVDSDFPSLAARIDAALAEIADASGRLIRVNRTPG